MLNSPSTFTPFEQFVNNAKGKKIALFLDYDGKLSPIVDNPDHAFMSNAVRSAVRNVAKYIPTTIISGRSRGKMLLSIRNPPWIPIFRSRSGLHLFLHTVLTWTLYPAVRPFDWQQSKISWNSSNQLRKQ